MTLRRLALLLMVTMLGACDSTPGLNPFAECTVVFTVAPPQIDVARGDSVLFTARRYGFCDQARTVVGWRMDDTVVATLRPVTDSTAFVRGRAVGHTVMTVVDQADTLHRAGVGIVVLP